MHAKFSGGMQAANLQMLQWLSDAYGFQLSSFIANDQSLT